MSNANVSDDKRRASRQRIRWVIYPSLAVCVTLILGVCALFYFGTFSRLRHNFSPKVTEALRVRRLALPVPADPDQYPMVYANPQAYAAYWRASRSGNLPQRLQLEHTGRVLSLPEGTVIWYQPRTANGVLTPVHLIGSRYLGRIYWATNADFS